MSDVVGATMPTPVSLQLSSWSNLQMSSASTLQIQLRTKLIQISIIVVSRFSIRACENFNTQFIAK